MIKLRTEKYFLLKDRIFLSQVVDDNGELHLEKLEALIPDDFKEIAVQMGKDCKNPEGGDLCERAWWFHQCWKKNDPYVSDSYRNKEKSTQLLSLSYSTTSCHRNRYNIQNGAIIEGFTL